MTMFEFWVAWAFNLKGEFGVLAVITLIASIILLFLWFITLGECSGEGEAVHKGSRSLLWVTVPVLALSSIIASAPGMDDLWKVRLGLMKLEIVNKENLTKLSDRADEVVSALECKYLGVHCPGQPEKEKAK